MTAGDDPVVDGVLPEPVRNRVVALAADAIGSMDPDEIPGPLRRVARFRAASRSRLAAVATPLAVSLTTDDGFRRRVAARVRTSSPELCSALDEGVVPHAVDPVELAAHAFLLGVDDWPRLAAAAAADAARADAEQAGLLAAERDRLATELAAARAEIARLGEELAAAPSAAAGAEVAEARAMLRRAQGQVRAAESAADEARAAAEAATADADAAVAAKEAEVARLRASVQGLRADLEATRRAAREGRALLDVRTRLLLDTLLGAARGLEQELAPATTDLRPADTAGGRPPGDSAPEASRAWVHADDPDHLGRLLALPRVHLVVDGYNVTKTGYGELPLADQRERLLGGLAALVARTRAEVTAVFDGAQLDAVPAVGVVRGVRVRFSDPGETADTLIGRLVRAEPAGRPVVVVSTDREVADAARRDHAHHADSLALLRLLGR